MASDEGKKVTLKSSDGEEFLVEEVVAMQSQVIRHMIEDGCADSVIPVPNVNSKILSKVIDYCNKAALISLLAALRGLGVMEAAEEEDLRGHVDFVLKDDLATLFDLLKAADYLNIIGLRGLIKQTMADMVKGKTPEKIRQLYEKKKMTPEEKKEFQREYPSLFSFGGDHIEEENIEILTPEEQEVIRRENQRAFEGEDDIEEELHIEEKPHWAFDNKELLEELRDELRRAFEEQASPSDNEEVRQTFEELMRASNFEEHQRAYEKHLRAFEVEKLRGFDELRSAFYMKELRELFPRAFDNEGIPRASNNEEVQRAFEEVRRASNLEERRRAFDELRQALEEKQLLDLMGF